jgi:peptidoglycan/xylan/chitin deacetylase (PgdA/CDA1 family)
MLTARVGGPSHLQAPPTTSTRSTRFWLRRQRRTMTKGLKELAAFILCAAGLPALSRRLHRQQLAILLFHGVEAEPLSPPCNYVHDAIKLRRQLEYVARFFRVLALEEALDGLYSGTLPDRAATLTFDDGCRSILNNAAPMLRDIGIPAAVFLATGPIGTAETLWPDQLWLSFARTNLPEVDLRAIGLGTLSLRTAADRGAAFVAAVERYKDLPDGARIEGVTSLVTTLAPESDGDAGPFRLLSWDEAQELASDGQMTLHPHSVTHAILSRCSDEKVEHEIFESCTAVERVTGRPPTIFAYPNGRAQDFDERSKVALRRRGIRWALACTYGFAHHNSDPLALPRIGIGSDVSFARFRLIVSGALWWRIFENWWLRKRRPPA